MAIDLTRFHGTFLAESFAGLDAMEADLLLLEQGSREPERVQSIFRVVHSIKGTAGSLGFEKISDFSHHLEALLDAIRNGRHDPDAETVTTLLAAVDALRGMLNAVQGAPGPKDGLIAELRGRLSPRPANGEAGGARLPETPVPAGAVFLIRFSPHPAFFASGNDPLRIIRELAGLGELSACCESRALPEIAELAPEESYLSWEIRLAGRVTQARIEEVFAWVSEDCDLHVEALPEASTASASAEIFNERKGDGKVRGRRAADRSEQELPRAQSVNASRANSLQVSTEKVDSLVNLVGELVITQTMLKQCADHTESAGNGQLSAAIALLERNTRDLQQAILAIRMLPVSFIFGRFHRLVRDVGMSLGKKVELKVSGEGSELDKTMIEKLFDPLTHLVRNAIDHGIESPEERRAAGKREIGTLSLHAQHKGGNIEIEVRDDGRGISRERVRAKALEQSLIAAGDEMDDAKIQQLIFASGFSTAEKVTDISGRGVGLDVVRQNIGALGGGIDIQSKEGEGTRFLIRLPLTLAIVEGMFVEVAAHHYVLPLTFIIECIHSSERPIKTVAGQGIVVEVRGEYLPVVELKRLCGVANALPLGEGVLVLLEAEDKKVALLVDNLLGQDQVVIKSLETNFGRVPYIAGATILGDGRVALILDVNSIVRGATVEPAPQYH
jgi:two-component system, chemotaxis family, sensor kinase CheA